MQTEAMLLGRGPKKCSVGSSIIKSLSVLQILQGVLARILSDPTRQGRVYSTETRRTGRRTLQQTAHADLLIVTKPRECIHTLHQSSGASIARLAIQNEAASC